MSVNEKEIINCTCVQVLARRGRLMLRESIERMVIIVGASKLTRSSRGRRQRRGRGRRRRVRRVVIVMIMVVVLVVAEVDHLDLVGLANRIDEHDVLNLQQENKSYIF